MTRNKQFLFGGLLLLLAITFLLLPRFIGMGVRQATVSSLLTLFPAETRNQLTITEQRFDEGWFASGAQVDLEYQPPGLDDSIAVQLDFDIRHGPLLWTERGLRLGIAHAQIQPSFDEADLDAALADLPFALPVLRLELLASFNQSMIMALNIAPIDYAGSEGTLNFAGLDAQLLANPDQSAQFELFMGQLDASDNASRVAFSLGGMEIISDTERLDDLLAPSRAALSIPSLRSTGPFQFTVNDINARSSLAVSPAGADSIKIEQQLQLSDIDSELPLSSLDWTFSLREVRTELFSSYYALIAELQDQLDGNGMNAEVSRLGQEVGLLLLQNRLAFGTVLAMNAYAGDHRLELQLDWAGQPDLANLTALDMNTAVDSLEVSVDLDFDLEAVLRSPVAGVVDLYVQEGYIRIANGRIRMEARLSDGELTMNGRPMPLDGFLQ